MKDKIFRDTVHGNIRIPDEYCKTIIDTILFQRLRRIEQSSVRSLFPCARHDRFIHSLGVFYIGTRIVDWVEQNTKKNETVWKGIEESWKKVTTSYLLACLLHDVGHAPFSHTFEKYYDFKQGSLLNDLLKEVIPGDAFAVSLEDLKDAKQHEKVSAYLLAKYYNEAVRKIGGDVEYAARMIMGYAIDDDKSYEYQLVNCFITVLHGEVDADRLDYAVRDQWAAGFSSARIDIERLLRSMIIVLDTNYDNKLRLCFTKSAIDTIEGLVQIKDFQKKWVFRHQNVIYDQHILSAALESMAEKYITDKLPTTDDVLKYIFNIKVFDDIEYSMPDGLCLYLLSDDTIIQLLRTTLKNNPYAKEWLARQYKKKPLWKTPAEYNRLFEHRKGVIKKKKIEALLKRHGLEANEYYIAEVEYEPYAIPENQVWFWINDETVDAKEIISGTTEKKTVIYYLYVNSDRMDDKNEIIKAIKGIV
ncbi:MAG: hypothetical protein CW336_01840 [Bacteroidetes bacterium]|nr:hypothetical protein [Bacteroidota bacterium]